MSEKTKIETETETKALSPGASMRLDAILKGVFDKLASQRDLNKAQGGLMRDLNIKIDCLLRLLADKEVVSNEEYEGAYNEILGVRFLEETEEIKKGDVAWIGYEAILEGQKNPIAKSEMAVSVGEGRVSFEDSLLGRKIGDKIEHTEKMDDPRKPDMMGKNVTFMIDILKVKTLVDGGPHVVQ